ncbi:tRNA threonylcarbamoyladenosine biosynthesis protein TsaB [Jeotgalicoccus saudimassiliensis]|uniref:tRNA threonylcarbamoyladenosine biosynthesis protein TsaB n=1 Tax=Jeotgalicoccus saudimassiliensis TaxID=1461582 RepID=A0A078MDA3_9STAP|nr:tRNA (adenosine(37)-N6)-threonylcarbamoyltransferase complex dimerization subunit type 1 TsaB [Jeotgalicoccus saudimassiliensis]CEA03422.1 tRNA threonylcarbamoyladenosine biosynthesis protein TsaB [Jeotgalicoccus saudimassiliensis]
MISLLLDTSNQALSVAVNRNSRMVAEINTNYKKTHSETLVDNIQKVLEIADIKKNELDRIIVAKGPGSYTGVRIGITVAKMLAKQLDIPVYTVSSLFVLAVSNGQEGSTVPLIDARRGHVYGAWYKIGPDDYTEIIAPQYADFTALSAEIEDAVYLLNGEERITIDIEKYTHVTPRISQTERYEKALKLEDADQLVPDYLRISEAERNWQENR